MAMKDFFIHFHLTHWKFLFSLFTHLLSCTPDVEEMYWATFDSHTPPQDVREYEYILKVVEEMYLTCKYLQCIYNVTSFFLLAIIFFTTTIKRWNNTFIAGLVILSIKQLTSGTVRLVGVNKISFSHCATLLQGVRSKKLFNGLLRYLPHIWSPREIGHGRQLLSMNPGSKRTVQFSGWFIIGG